ncbi:TPA: hypothetical protein SML50_001600 [Serratia fonticola]|uniref:hypothetical protein n=1 Tax=Serratia fonticola TaxID=47917 RepID=UPI00137754CA|nr:hypothetical protein [Serratia fonticola]NBJ36488.1 hypothetical protein [Serratia fonticola]HEJ9057338.1 hypothetical protein [Serratia fonticola]
MEFEIEIINPAKHPELAAQQVVIELIRAGKIDNSFNGTKALNTYQNLVEKYKALAAEPGTVQAKDNAIEPPASEAKAVTTPSKPAAVVAAKAKSNAAKPSAETKVRTKVSAPAVKESTVAAEVVAKPKKAKPNPTTAKKK